MKVSRINKQKSKKKKEKKVNLFPLMDELYSRFSDKNVLHLHCITRLRRKGNGNSIYSMYTLQATHSAFITGVTLFLVPSLLRYKITEKRKWQFHVYEMLSSLNVFVLHSLIHSVFKGENREKEIAIIFTKL